MTTPGQNGGFAAGLELLVHDQNVADGTVADDEDARRKRRAEEERTERQEMKKQKKKCAYCHRAACIC